MKIVLVEVRGQQEMGERTFEQSVVTVGRDPATCDVFFDQAEWPMVSRKHGEFRVKEGQCQIIDRHSSFGTFLNGYRIMEPTRVAVGANVQFGAGGPVLRIISIEHAPVTREEGGAYGKEMPTKQTPAGASSFQPPPAPASQPDASASPAALEFVNEVTGQIERLGINTDSLLLGRDTSSDVPVNAAAAVVSRRHAEIRRQGGKFTLVDLDSFNGTLLNDQRITAPKQLSDGDRIQLGRGGPILYFVDLKCPPALIEAQRANEQITDEAGARAAPVSSPPPVRNAPANIPDFQHTIFVKPGSGSLQQQIPSTEGIEQVTPMMRRDFDGKSQLSVGRSSENDLRLDGLQISNHHARLARVGNDVIVEDIGSTNGVYVNGVRITGRQTLRSQDIVQIGPFVLKADAQRGIAVFDTRSKTRIDAIDINKVVASRPGRGAALKLLDNVELTIQPNEFVGLLGPSGAGKSTLMDALNGMRLPTSGRVFFNDLDLYQHLDSLKQSIGYVPQDDVIHRELTVYRTLYYVARLRLSRDVTKQEIDQIIGEVLDVTDLTERRDVPVARLSGGQRKRVSIAIELITKPSVIFLDEPTSGLDPATEGKIMRLFRQIAESGRTVILTTHAMENVRLFDKVVILMRGRLIFYGTPKEALAHVRAGSFKDIYDLLEAPIEAELKRLPPLPPGANKEQKRAYEESREHIAEAVADEWRRLFQGTEAYQRNVMQPLSGLTPVAQIAAVARRRSTVTDAVRQWATFTQRYVEVFMRDRLNLLILLGQAPIIALFTYLVVSEKAPRDFPYFVLALVAIWFGTSVAAREIVKERAIYDRERMINLRLLPYVGSKLFVLSLIVSLQCILLFGALKLLPVYLPGLGGGLPQLLVMILTGMVGIALGLFVSAVVKTSEMATSLVPLILIPQILFSGLFGVPVRTAKVVSVTIPATWSFDEMKRLSTLETLNEEGSIPKYMEERNREEIKKTQAAIDDYRQKAAESVKEYERKLEQYQTDTQTDPGLAPPAAPTLDPAPRVSDARVVGDDLKNFVSFTHPWGNRVLNPVVLFLMFLSFFGATVITLRTQDVK